MRFQRRFLTTKQGFYELVKNFTWEYAFARNLPPTKMLNVLWKDEFLMVSFDWKSDGLTLISLRTIPLDGDWTRQEANVMVDAFTVLELDQEREQISNEFLKALVAHLDRWLGGVTEATESGATVSGVKSLIIGNVEIASDESGELRKALEEAVQRAC